MRAGIGSRARTIVEGERENASRIVHVFGLNFFVKETIFVARRADLDFELHARTFERSAVRFQDPAVISDARRRRAESQWRPQRDQDRRQESELELPETFIQNHVNFSTLRGQNLINSPHFPAKYRHESCDSL